MGRLLLAATLAFVATDAFVVAPLDGGAFAQSGYCPPGPAPKMAAISLPTSRTARQQTAVVVALPPPQNPRKNDDPF
jgi:hypothetical protein